MDRYLTPLKIKTELDQYIIGNEPLKKVLANIGYIHHLRRLVQINYREENLPRTNALIVGRTGTGKTMAVKSLATILDHPFVYVSASSLSKVGWKGTDINELLGNALRHIDMSECPVIFIDEVDKLGLASTDNHTESIQYDLLSVMDGNEINFESSHTPIKVYLETALIILGGSFEHYFKDNKRSIGFNKSKQDQIGYDALDFLNKNFVRELANRIHVVSRTEELSDQQLRDVIFNSKNSIFKQYEEMFCLCDHKLELTEDMVLAIISYVKNGNHGIRGIGMKMFEMLNDKIMDLNPPYIEINIEAERQEDADKNITEICHE